jgi:hypothetical protein
MIIETPSGTQSSKGPKRVRCQVVTFQSQCLRYFQMVDDNPPAYTDVDGAAILPVPTRSRASGQARHYPNIVHSRSNANLAYLPPHPQPSVDLPVPTRSRVSGQARHYPNIVHSKSNPNLPSLPPHSPPSVDQVHVFEPKHNIHGMSCVARELFSLAHTVI